MVRGFDLCGLRCIMLVQTKSQFVQSRAGELCHGIHTCMCMLYV